MSRRLNPVDRTPAPASDPNVLHVSLDQLERAAASVGIDLSHSDEDRGTLSRGEADEFEVRDDTHETREALFAGHLFAGLKYVLSFAAKKGPHAKVYFTFDAYGVPCLVGHDERNAGRFYLGSTESLQSGGVHCDLRLALTRKDAITFRKFLGGLGDDARVRIYSNGDVVVRDGTQPPAPRKLSGESVTFGARMPSAMGRVASGAGTYSIDARKAMQARNVPGTTVTSYASEGCEWVFLRSGTQELIAQAVLAEAGMELYSNDGNQVAIAGTTRVEGLGANWPEWRKGAVVDLTVPTKLFDGLGDAAITALQVIAGVTHGREGAEFTLRDEPTASKVVKILLAAGLTCERVERVNVAAGELRVHWLAGLVPPVTPKGGAK